MQERRERHRQNYLHITVHTSQTWADTFITELNDTHVEAELRIRHIPPQARRSACKHIGVQDVGGSSYQPITPGQALPGVLARI